MTDLFGSLVTDGPARVRPDGFRTLAEGAVTRAPAGATVGLYFTVDGFDPGLEWGPAPWRARVNPDHVDNDLGSDGPVLILPAVGDRVLVAFPGGTTDNPWVIDWWPATYQETRV